MGIGSIFCAKVPSTKETFRSVLSGRAVIVQAPEVF